MAILVGSERRDTNPECHRAGGHELLTGGPPFTKKDLEKAGMLEMLRIIREQDPSKPSTKLSTAGIAHAGRQSRHRAGEANAAGARRAGLDRDEGDGEGPQPALRDG